MLEILQVASVHSVLDEVKDFLGTMILARDRHSISSHKKHLTMSDDLIDSGLKLPFILFARKENNNHSGGS